MGVPLLKTINVRMRLSQGDLYGGCSSVGRASDCGSEGRQFEPAQSPITYTGPWCNGSIRGSNPLGECSNRSGSAIKT